MICGEVSGLMGWTDGGPFGVGCFSFFLSSSRGGSDMCRIGMSGVLEGKGNERSMAVDSVGGIEWIEGLDGKGDGENVFLVSL